MNIKEFARVNNCSLGSLYNKVKRNRDKLEGHIDESKSIMELDSYAMEFLLPKDIKARAEIDKEIRTLKTTVFEMGNTIERLKSELSAANRRITEVTESRDTYKSKCEEYVNRLNALEEENRNLKTENEKLRKNQKKKLF